MKPADAKKFLKDNGVKYVLAQFVDMHGTAKAKSVPMEHYDTVITDGAGFAGFAMNGMGMRPNSDGDYMAVGDPSTLSLMPWQPGYARMASDGHVHGKPWPYCSRVILKKQLARMSAKGWTFFTGMEPEFSLVACDATDTLAKPCYDYKGLSRSRAFLERLAESMRAVGIDVYQIDHEDANGQFEINYTYTDALTSCDHYTFFKMGAAEIANEMGLICSFMPKPFSNRPGNGLHMHMSIGDGKKNLFEDKSDKRGLDLSPLAYHFIGGLLAHAPALTAVCCPTVNSYKRLVVGRSLTGATWAPAYICYGNNNRSGMVRGPGGRIEMRLPDGSANPYLATAAVIAAGLDGVERKLEPGEPVVDSLYDATPAQLRRRGIKVLPQNLKEALDAFEKDAVVKGALGVLADDFIELKRREWVEYMRHVSDWEVDNYLQFF